MGDSFRNLSQSLSGDEDEEMGISEASTPSMISQGPDDNDDSVY